MGAPLTGRGGWRLPRSAATGPAAPAAPAPRLAGGGEIPAAAEPCQEHGRRDLAGRGAAGRAAEARGSASSGGGTSQEPRLSARRRGQRGHYSSAAPPSPHPRGQAGPPLKEGRAPGSPCSAARLAAGAGGTGCPGCGGLGGAEPPPVPNGGGHPPSEGEPGSGGAAGTRG